MNAAHEASRQGLIFATVGQRAPSHAERFAAHIYVEGGEVRKNRYDRTETEWSVLYERMVTDGKQVLVVNRDELWDSID